MSKSFAQVASPSYDPVLLVVDALNLAFRWKHKKVSDFAVDYIRTVQSLRKSYKAKYVVIAADWGSSSFRKSIYPEYKGNREKLREEQTQQEEEEFQQFLEDYSKTLELIREQCQDWLILRYHKVEADDIAAHIATNIPDSIEHVWLMSSDKDWDLLISDNVSRFSYVTTKEMTYDKFPEVYGVENPDRYLSVKCRIVTGKQGDQQPCRVAIIGGNRIPFVNWDVLQQSLGGVVVTKAVKAARFVS